GSFVARGTAWPRLALGTCQMLLIAAIAWTAFMVSESLPYWPIDLRLSESPWNNFQLDLVRCLWAVLPPACLWGASFPLALAAVASRHQDSGRLVGGVYAANTVGAIVGALAFSIVVIPQFGTLRAEQLLIAISSAAALVALVPLLLYSLQEDWDMWAILLVVGLPVVLIVSLGMTWPFIKDLIPTPWIPDRYTLLPGILFAAVLTALVPLFLYSLQQDKD